MIEIMNLRRDKPVHPYDVCVDRRSVLGNPFLDRDGKSRHEVCDKYEDWFHNVIDPHFPPVQKVVNELAYLQQIHETYGKVRLFCWCAPKRCHAETIKRWLERQL